MTAAIVIGRRITRGHPPRASKRAPTSRLYDNFGYSWLDMQFVAMPAPSRSPSGSRTSGWEAVPIFPFPPEAYPQGDRRP
jgi:hypothetical protein